MLESAQLSPRFLIPNQKPEREINSPLPFVHALWMKKDTR
jgi:hypothetical protein